MTPERWEEICQVLEEVVALPEEERLPNLAQRSASDPELRAEVESLLKANTSRVDRLCDVAGQFLLDQWPELPKGTQLGAYFVDRRIGTGGMSQVYLGRPTDEQIDRQVAIKVLSETVPVDETSQRFYRELRTLAKLTHPSIARFYDHGVAPDGRPFLVMEYVAGYRIDDYCDSCDLSLEDLLGLFAEVCKAVSFAHANLVVHRDLKPSNILVNKNGRPILLDFGIAWHLAELSDDASSPRPRLSQTFTPNYASPEQVMGGRITTATDVYGLGVVLYRLLTGSEPCCFDTYSPDELRTRVCHETPSLPSAALRELVALGMRVKRESKKTPKRWSPKQLKGDLDAIVLKALEKKPERRYFSVEALAKDLRRYLNGGAVEARPSSFSYSAGKFFRRHPWKLLTGGLFFALIVGFGLVMAQQKSEIAEERDQAEALAEFLEEVFSHSDPQTLNTPETTARELLDQAVEKLDRRLDQSPSRKARLLVSLGTAHLNLGLYDKAALLLGEAVQLSQETSPGSELTGDAYHALGMLKLQEANFQLAEQFLQTAYLVRREVLGPSSEKTANTLSGLGVIQKRLGQLEQAEISYRESLRIRRLHKDDRNALASVIQNLAALMRTLNRYPEAEELYIEAIDLKTEEVGANHPSTAISIHNLALLYKDQGRYAEAKQRYLKAIEIRRQSLGDGHPDLAQSLNNLGVLLLSIGELEEAEQALLESLRIRKQSLRPDHPDLGNSYHNLAASKLERGDFSGAATYFGKALSVREQIFGPSHARSLHTRSSLATALQMQGHLQEAEAILLDCLRLLQIKNPVDQRQVASTKIKLATVLAKTARSAEAEQYARQASAALHILLGDEHPEAAEADSVLGGILLLQRNFTEAEPLLQSSYETLRNTKGVAAAATKETKGQLTLLKKLTTPQK